MRGAATLLATRFAAVALLTIVLIPAAPAAAQPPGTASTGALGMEMDPAAAPQAGEPGHSGDDLATVPGRFRPAPAVEIPPHRLAAAKQRLDGIPATLVVMDPADQQILVRIDRLAAQEQAPPCSTFKIPNSLISLEEGAVSLDDHAIPRDRVRIPDDDWRARGRWAEDQDLVSALRHSTVWYFQELARRVGYGPMRDWLATFDYGNRDLAGGLDTFWLGSTLRISAEEQARFLSRLVSGDLPVAAEHVALLEEGLRRESGEEAGQAWTWYGKTGSCQNPPYEGSAERSAGKSYGDFPEDTPWVGWLVGWIERQHAGPVVYAYRVDAADYEEVQARRDPVIRPLLVDLGLLPPE